MRNNLQNLREKRRYTLKEVAEKTGISYVILSKLENEKQPIQEQYAHTLADFYKVSLDYLFARDVSNIPPTIVYREAPPTFQTIITALPKLSNAELLRIYGAIDMIVDARKNSPTASVAETIIKHNIEKDAANK